MTFALNSAAQAMSGGASALGQAANSGLGKKGIGDQPKLGMSMWFDVVVHDTDLVTGGDQSLGDWASCNGLNVKFNTEQLDEGGEYDSPWHMPTKITYGEITLERAMVKESSDRVKNWLTQVATKWMNGTEGGAKDNSMAVGTKITIYLWSSLAPGVQGSNLVHTWELNDAIPVGWTGPTLSAKANEVATEKLTIAHRGFLEPKAVAGSSSPSDTAEQGSLTLKYPDTGGTITFPYNPKSVSLDKTVTFKQGKGFHGGAEPQVTDPGKLALKFSALRLEGATSIAANIDKLWEWLDPIPPVKAATSAPKETAVTTAAPARKSSKSKGKKKKDDEEEERGTPKELELRLGNGLGYTVLLKAVSANYSRFSKTGEPIRADITLTLEVVRALPKRTNPSSGGEPGGSLHTALAGETLPAIATATYGDPGAWRDIAQDNGIDDPMRLRPGRSLYLAGT